MEDEEIRSEAVWLLHISAIDTLAPPGSGRAD